MRGLRLLLQKELREMVRTMRLPVVLVVFAIVGLISPLMARYIREILGAVGGAEFQGVIPDPTARDAVSQLTRNVGQFGVLITILVTMGTVAREKERGTTAFILTKPVGRGAFLGAKLIAIGLLLALATALAGALCWVYTAILFEPLPAGWYAAAISLLWLSLAAFGSVTFAASTITSSSLVAGGIGLAGLMLSSVLSILPNLASYLPTGLWGIADELAIGHRPDPLIGPIVFNLAVVATAIALAWWSFSRQEL